MFDLFTEEIEVQIKNGISNLYWFKGDLNKAWLRSGVDWKLCETIFLMNNPNGQKMTKRELMGELYLHLRNSEFNRKLEISRNFVRILIEHKNFVPQDEKHRIEIAERCALKLKEIIAQQGKPKEEYKKQFKEIPQKSVEGEYLLKLESVRNKFHECYKLENPQKRGYEFEKIFAELMSISSIQYERSYKIEGEQVDLAIKHDGHFYLAELKWVDRKIDHKDIASLYMKVEGKMESRGIFIAMNGYSHEILNSLPRGKELKVLLFDGNHFTNVISGMYTFQQLMDYSISQASLKGELYCSHKISK